MKRTKKFFIVFISLFTSMLIPTLLIINYHNKRNLQFFFQQKAENQNILWQALVLDRHTLADSYFESFIMQEEILKLLRDFKFTSNEDEQKLIRLKLFRKLFPIYEKLKENGVRQLHFHTFDSKSLLRMNAPDHFGDSLKEARPDVYLANSKLKIVRGFESGKVLTGFRNVYPIIYNGEHLGSVEISFSFESIRKIFQNLHLDYSYYALIKSEESRKHLNAFKSMYKEVVPGWIIEDPYREQSDTLKPLNPQYQKVFDLLKNNKKFINSLQNHNPSATYFKVDNKNYLMIFTPILDTTNRHSAVLFSISQSKELDSLLKNYLINILTAIFSALTISLTIAIIIDKNTVLADRERYIETILSTINNGLYLINEKGNTIFVNKALTDILGYEKDEVIGYSAHDIFHISHFDTIKCPLLTVIDLNKTYSDIEIFKHKDGHPVYVHVTAKPFFYKGEKSALISFSDISQLKAREDDLERSNYIMSLIFENSANAMMLVDEKRILQINDKMINQFCVPIDLINKNIDKVYSFISINFKNPSEFLKYVYSSDGETNILLETADDKHIEIKRVNVSNFKFIGILWIFMDKTEEINKIKELEELRHKAETASRMKSAFLSNMSHEIRTPINGIIGALELISEDQLSSEVKHYLNIIKSSSEHLLSLINDILDLSKIESGHMKLEYIPFDPIQVLKKVESIICPIAYKKQIDFHIEYENIEICVYGDPHRLGQILINLSNNAVKFTEKGEVTIKMNVVSESETNITLKFIVKDTGIGIPEDKLNLLFKPFTQLDPSHTRKFGGTGLGLAITYNLVKMFKGTISVESELGKGSTFIVEIPFEKAELCECHKSDINNYEMEKIDLSNLKLLLVEDNKVNIMITGSMLQKIGISKIEFAFNGLEAIEKMKNKKYDLVFMDISMPEMDGLTATRIIRTDPAIIDKNTPIIAMTANAFEEDKQECLNAGMNGYIAKPITIDTIKNAIYSILKLNLEKESKVERIDFDHMRLKEISNDEEFIRMLLSSYFTDAENALKELKEALNQGHAEKIVELAHRMKGGSYNIGATNVGNIAKEIEVKAKEKHLSDISILLERLESEYNKLAIYLKRYYNIL